MGVRCRTCIVAMAALALVGCASRPIVRIAYNADARRDAVRIVVLEPAPPANLSVDPGVIAPTASAIGGTWMGLALLPLLLVPVADAVAKSASLTQAATDAGFDPGAALSAALADELERLGFRVSRHRMSRSPAASVGEPRWIGDYRPWIGSSDAVLDVQWLRVGFRSGTPVSPYMPWAIAAVRMVEPRSHEILYRDVVASLGEHVYIGAAVTAATDRATIENETRFRFDDFPSLVARRDVAFEALRVAARALAERIAFDLASP